MTIKAPKRDPFAWIKPGVRCGLLSLGNEPFQVLSVDATDGTAYLMRADGECHGHERFMNLYPAKWVTKVVAVAVDEDDAQASG